MFFQLYFTAGITVKNFELASFSSSHLHPAMATTAPRATLLFLFRRRKYGDFRLTPWIYAHSSPTCCDRAWNSRQSPVTSLFRVVKVQNLLCVLVDLFVLSLSLCCIYILILLTRCATTFRSPLHHYTISSTFSLCTNPDYDWVDSGHSGQMGKLKWTWIAYIAFNNLYIL